MRPDKKKELVRRCIEKVVEGFEASEGNQPQAESGTTACSAAGGGTNEETARRSTGREPCVDEVVELLKKRRALYDELQQNDRRSRLWIMVEEYDAIIREIDDLIEARRRNQDD